MNAEKLKQLHEIVVELHEAAERAHATYHAASERYHALCDSESTLGERQAAKEYERPLFQMWCVACERRDAARVDFFDAARGIVNDHFEAVGLPRAWDGKARDLYPELFKS